MSTGKYRKCVPPHTHLIQSMEEADINLKIAVGELIANSIEFGALNIDLTYTKKKCFGYRDDGDGCADLEGMIALGSHAPTKNKKRNGGSGIGRHGVGFKDAVIWMGAQVSVHSCTVEGKKESVFADWEEIKCASQWNFEFEDDSERSTHGVTITVTELRDRFRGWKSVSTHIAELFSAAIDAGIVITVDEVPVRALPAPILEGEIHFQVDHDGLRCEGRCGILADNKTPFGWNVRYGHLTIAANYTAEGFGEHSPQGFWGMMYMVDAEKKWKLTRNKTRSENLPSMLNCPELQKIIEPILKKLEQRDDAITIQLNHSLAQTDLTEMLEEIRVSEAENGFQAVRKSRSQNQPPPDEPRQPRIPNPNPQPRQPKTWLPDELSRTKKLLRLAQRVQLIRYNGDDIGYAELAQSNTTLRIYIDNYSEHGKQIWRDRFLLDHQAIMLLGIFFGTDTDIPAQLRLPIGETPIIKDKIAKTCAYLFKHLKLSLATNTSSAA